MSLVLGIALAVLAAALAWAWFSFLRRGLKDDGRLRLRDMLARHEAAMPAQVGSAITHQTALAVRRCVLCTDHARCDAWLGSGAREGFEAFCPNAGFVLGAGLKSRP